jgi:hydrophobe/amphiphile efflux-1 (HAE1) family protein
LELARCRIKRREERENQELLITTLSTVNYQLSTVNCLNMSFNISAWSIKQPVPTIVLFLILTIGGLVSFPLLGIDDSPNIDVPSVSISVTQTGADPSELESQVTKKVEDAVAGLGNIDHIISTVNDGSSNTTVNFLLGTNSDRATNDVRNAIAQIRQSLPQDINDPVVKRVEFAGSSIMSYAVVSDRQTVEQLSDLIDLNISRVLLSVKGVAQVQRIGGRDRDIRVDLNPQQLQSLGITATQVNEQIRTFNINLPGGRTEIGNSEQTVRTLGSAKTIEQLKAYQITLPQGGFVPLSSLGKVDEGYAEARQAARLNNKPVVAFSILRSTGSTLVTVEEAVREAVKTMEKTLPPDVKLELIYTLADHIRDSYQASVDALILGAALAIVTIFIFLRDWRATLIAAVALPLSIIPTFAVLRMVGYTLNGMTLLALSLVVGILVDDAIVEIENIERHVGMGKTPYQAALDASAEIGLAVVATTMTIVSVFAPVAFMPGIPGQFFRPFGVTVSASVLFSLLVARTVTPMMAAYMFKEKGHHEELKKDQLSYQYRRLLTWALKHRAIVLILAVALFFGSIQLIPFIPTGFIDRDDTGLSTVSIELPPGSTLSQTDLAVQQATKLLLAHPAVDSVLETEGAPTVSGGAGGGGGGASGVNTASLYVKLKPAGKRIGQQKFEEEMRPKLRDVPGVRLSFAQGRVGGKKQMSIVLKSENAEALTKTAASLTQQMRQVPGLIEVESSASLVQQIARTASLATIGDIDSNLAKFDLPDRQIPIHVMLASQFRSDIETIKNLQVPAKNNTFVPLRAVADITLGSGPSQIDRYDRARQVSVEGNLLDGTTLGEAAAAVNKLPAMNPLPPGVEQESSGDAKVMQDIFSGFAGALGTAVLFIYGVLVLLFANFLHPVTIMVALPLSLGGALLGLLVGQKSLGLYALIGVVLLMGIVTKNSILLVDYAIMNQKEGEPTYEATLDSGIARLRPILMTTIAMIAGMVPIALGIGAGSQVRSPMAMAVIGGLMTSTLLTLVVIPVVFTYLDGLQVWIFNLVRGKKGSKGRSKFSG